MKLYLGTKKILLPGRVLFLFILLLLIFLNFYGQETNSRASGRVYSEENEKIDGATVALTHEPTQNTYVAVTHADGFFSFFNLKPGGPYTLMITSVGYDTLQMSNLYVHLTDGNFLLESREIAEFTLRKKVTSLEEIKVIGRNNFGSKAGVETIISEATLKAMPTISRSLQDFVRLVPQAKVNGDGVMSLAGQNNRFNAFYIDGANNTDVKGVSVNGMNGGQAGSSPISIEAIEEINVLQAPYNTQYGNFTGGSINAISRSGSNENKSSAWYFFRNENLTGRSPQPLEKTGSPGEFHRPKLTDFFNQTFGAWNSGALVRNKLFYFVLFERQNDERPQPFNMLDYRGNSNEQQLLALTEFINSKYQYDPGSFSETKDQLIATRLNIKLDWNTSTKDKSMLSYRLNDAWRMTPPRPSSATAISFHNNGIIIPSTTHSGSFEWDHFLKTNANNRLLLTFTNQADQRKWIGQAFPSVTIVDGTNATLTFGSEANTGVNDFKASDLGLLDVFTYVRGKHVYTTGTDINYTSIDVKAIPAYFGAYTFRSVDDFMNVAAPARLQRFFYLTENGSLKFHTLRTSFFVNDEIRPRTNLKFNFGLRLDVNAIPSKPAADQFFNDSAINIISAYYDLEQATSGSTMNPHWSISPRASVEYRWPKDGISLRVGAGIFQGHIVNAWLFDIFNSSTGSIDMVPQEFIADPYNQPTPQSLNRDPADFKGILSLVAKHFKYPSVVRTSFTAEKKTLNKWTFSIEGIFTKNIHEAVFRNVNIMPPIGQSSSPDSRNVYSTSPFPTKIELKSSGIKNPYTGVYLLTNNHDAKGYAYSLSFVIQKQAKRFSFNGSYTYGISDVLFEITGPQTPIPSQWRNMETINGRNFTARSVSDNDLRHRVTTWISREFNFAKGRTATIISLFYNGQSGSPYSYVYSNSMINDNGKRLENFDLIYIPTEEDLNKMSFAPITTPVPYSPQEQKYGLNAFIWSDKYLRKHRGEFAERNGARLPFTHIVDLRVQQDLIIKINRKPVKVSILYDVFNFTNMLNKDWGHIDFLSNDSYPLIKFESFVNASTLTPQYQFTPVNGKPYSLQTSTIPGNSARWTSQLGIKMSLD